MPLIRRRLFDRNRDGKLDRRERIARTAFMAYVLDEEAKKENQRNAQAEATGNGSRNNPSAKDRSRFLKQENPRKTQPRLPGIVFLLDRRIRK